MAGGNGFTPVPLSLPYNKTLTLENRMKAMVDLETLSSRSNASIIAIGAVVFSETEVFPNVFYLTVDAASNEKVGLDVSASTFLWWMQQSDAARAQFKKEGIPLPDALEAFSTWCISNNIDEVWGNGADFDCVILGNAYEACGMKRPWSYSKNRCFRTLKSRVTTDVANELWAKYATGTHHNALDDALRQANIAVEIFRLGK